MGKLLFSVVLIATGLLLGRGLRYAERIGWLPESISLPAVFRHATLFAMLVLNPIVIIGAFWTVDIRNIELAYLPVLGILALVAGGVVAILFARLQRLGRAQTGSMFVSGSFSNMGSFGTLFCFAFFGEQSLAYVAMFRLLEEFVYYLVGFPVAKLYGSESGGSAAGNPVRRLAKDPFILTLLGSMLAGMLLNLSPWERPAAYAGVIEWIVPLFVLLLVASIGYNMKISKIREYVKPCFAIAATKFLIVPVFVGGIALLLGIGDLHGGMVLGVVVVLSAMPPAFTSLIPPQLYKLDVDLANSSWLLNSALLVVELPLLYVFIEAWVN
jgi:Predicted permeases